MKLDRNLISIASLLAFSLSAFNVCADPHSDGLEFGKSNLSKLSSKVSSANAQAMPHYTNAPPQSSNFGTSSLFDVGVTRINTCKSAVHGPDQVANQECDAVNFLAKNPENRTKFPVSPNDPIVKGIGNTINNATAGDVTQACTTKTTTTPDIYGTEVCNQYNLIETKSCAIGQVVEVDSKANFLCNVTSNAVETVSCDKFLVVTCPSNPSWCTAGGISPGSVQKSTGSASITFSPPYLDAVQTINTQGRRETSTFTFNIVDMSRIGMFRLTYAQYDNWLGLRINGKWVRVFVGTLSDAQAWATDRLDIVTSGGRSYVDIGNGSLYALEPPYPGGVGIYAGSYDIDLRTYFTTGTNTIEFIVINGTYGGVGEAKFEVREFCNPCTQTWEDQCGALDKRTL